MIQKSTNRDTILDEIHRTRERMAEKFGGDIAAILEDAWKRQEASGARHLARSNVEEGSPNRFRLQGGFMLDLPWLNVGGCLVI